MWGLFFEMRAKPGHWDAYFEHVDRLRPRLADHPGLLWLERFRRADDADVLLSHQHWSGPEAIDHWRADPVHRASQSAGRRKHFHDYRIRVGPEAPPAEAPLLVAYGRAAVEAPGATVWLGITTPGRVVTVIPGGIDAEGIAGRPHVERLLGFAPARDYGQHDRRQAKPRD